MPNLSRDPFEGMFEDRRKWYRMWWDDIWSLSWKDGPPSVILGGGIGYGLTWLGVGMTLSVTTGGVGLGVLAAGFITWQVLKYPIKRIAANIIGLFKEEKPRWGQRLNSKVNALEANKSISEISEAQLRSDLAIAQSFGLVAKARVESSNKEIEELQLRVKALTLEKTQLENRVVDLEQRIKSLDEITETQKLIAESATTQKVSDAIQPLQEQLETQKETYEQQIEDLKHEHLKTLKATNSKLTKTTETNKTLNKKNQELATDRDRLVLRVQSMEAKLRKPVNERELSPEPPAYAAPATGSKPKNLKFFPEGKNDASSDDSVISSGNRSPGLGSDEER